MPEASSSPGCGNGTLRGVNIAQFGESVAVQARSANRGYGTLPWAFKQEAVETDHVLYHFKCPEFTIRNSLEEKPGKCPHLHPF